MKQPISFPRFLFILLSILVFYHCSGMKPNPRFRERPATPTQSEKAERNILRGTQGDGQFQRQIKQQIQNYMGVRYRWGGTTTAGMDCSGFVSRVFQNAIELELPHNARKMYGLGRTVARKNLHFGDLVFFKNIESAGVSHVGIYLGEDEFAHASTTRGVTISNLNLDYYKARYAGARRIHSRE